MKFRHFQRGTTSGMPILSPRPDMHELLQFLPQRRFIQTIRNRINDLMRRLGMSAYLDQYPGKQVPQAFSALYGPIGLQTPRRVGATGFLGLATLIDPATPVLPRNGNWKTGREGAFYWVGSNATAFLSWTNVAGSGPVSALPAGDIFQPVFEANGGALALHNIIDIKYSPNPGGAGASYNVAPSIHFDVDLYDKKRGRSITDGRVPAETFFASTLGMKREPGLRWEIDSDVEPRIYINQARLPGMDTDNTPYNNARVAFYVNITVVGYTTLAEDRDANS